MNNEAFRALINKNNNQQRSTEKSTKEIAREAVEHEFIAKRRRRRGGGAGADAGDRKRGGGGRGRGFDGDDDGSDSGSSSNDDDGEKTLKKQQQQQLQENDNEPEWKRRRREKRMQDGGSTNNNGTTVEYRDRAKERRMGSNLDYATLEGLTAPSTSLGVGEVGSRLGEDMDNDRKKQAELSKYLGGDIQHTHLVKGLDKALAEKVRREEMMMVVGDHQSKLEAQDDDLDRVLEDAQVLKEQQSHLQPKTELGKLVLSYLLQKQKSSSSSPTSPSTSLLASIPTPSPLTPASNISAIQKSIQLSVLTFSLESDVRQRRKTWEVPRMSMKAFGAHSSESSSATATSKRRRMNPLNHQMIAVISKKLDGRGDAGSSNQKTKYHGSSSSSSQAEKYFKNDSALANSVENTNINDKSVKEEADADSDDDIFENVGSYLPPQTVTSTAAASTSAPNKTSPTTKDNDDKHISRDEAKKQSIFDNLIPESTSSNNASIHYTKPVASLMQQHPKQPTQRSQTESRSVIDRDIFGAGGEGPGDTSISQLPYQKRRGPQSATLDGVSMANYQGGYGEEMDVDFGGNDDDDVDGGKKSDKWRRGKTGDKEKGDSIDGDADAADDLGFD
jgi:hypothetical protein